MKNWIIGRQEFNYKSYDNSDIAFSIYKDWDTDFEFRFYAQELKDEFKNTRVHFSSKAEALNFADKICWTVHYDSSYYLYSKSATYIQKIYGLLAAKITEYPESYSYNYKETSDESNINTCYGYIIDEDKMFDLGIIGSKDVKFWMKRLAKRGKEIVKEHKNDEGDE